MQKENYIRAELVERLDLSEDVAVFRFKPEMKIDFIPCQYVTLAVEESERLIQRPYSIASSKYDSLIEIFVDLVHQGTLTPRLWDMRPQDQAWLRRRVAGNFLMREDLSASHLFAATVTGGAPFVSMIRTMKEDLKKGAQRDVSMGFVHGASYEEELGFYTEELLETARDGWLNYVPTLSRPWEAPLWQGETGRVEDVLRKYLDLWKLTYRNSCAYGCGHPIMIKNVKQILERARYPADRIKEEKYYVSKE